MPGDLHMVKDGRGDFVVTVAGKEVLRNQIPEIRATEIYKH